LLFKGGSILKNASKANIQGLPCELERKKNW